LQRLLELTACNNNSENLNTDGLVAVKFTVGIYEATSIRVSGTTGGVAGWNYKLIKDPVITACYCGKMVGNKVVVIIR